MKIKIKEDRYEALLEAEQRLVEAEEEIETLQSDLTRAKHFLECEREARTRAAEDFKSALGGGHIVITREALQQFQVPMSELYTMRDKLIVAESHLKDAEEATKHYLDVHNSMQARLDQMGEINRELIHSNNRLDELNRGLQQQVAELCWELNNVKAELEAKKAGVEPIQAKKPDDSPIEEPVKFGVSLAYEGPSGGSGVSKEAGGMAEGDHRESEGEDPSVSERDGVAENLFDS